MSAPPAVLARRLRLGVLPLLLYRASAQCSSVVETITAADGTISRSFDALQEGTCAWMLMAGAEDQSNKYESLRLRNDGVTLIGDSQLRLCSPQIIYSHNGEGHVQCRQPEIAMYSADRPMPSEIDIPNAQYVMILFATPPESGTAVQIGYQWVEAGFTITFWPIAIVMGLSLLGTCVSAALLYLACFIRAKLNRQQGTVGATVSQRDAMAAAQRQQEKERRTLEALGALPTCTWKEDVQGQDGQAECCLCLEAYEPDQPLRTLPCGHYFHQACIDNWFQARRYTLRTCPLCKRDPVPDLGSDEEQAPAGGREGHTSVAQEAVQETPSNAVAVADGGAPSNAVAVADGGEPVRQSEPQVEPVRQGQPQATEIGRAVIEI